MAFWMMTKSAEVLDAGAGEKKTAFGGWGQQNSMWVGICLPAPEKLSGKLCAMLLWLGVLQANPVPQEQAQTHPGTSNRTPSFFSTPPSPSTNNDSYHPSKPERNAHMIQLRYHKPGNTSNWEAKKKGNGHRCNLLIMHTYSRNWKDIIPLLYNGSAGTRYSFPSPS